MKRFVEFMTFTVLSGNSLMGDNRINIIISSYNVGFFQPIRRELCIFINWG